MATDDGRSVARERRGLRATPLDAALAVLRRDGPGALSMRSVAAEAGVSPMALYRHVADKEALLRAVIQEVYGVFRRRLVLPVEGSDPLGWLCQGSERYLRFALEHPNYYRLLFVEPHGMGIDRYPQDFLGGRSPTFRQLRDTVAQCMAARVLRADEPSDVALTLYAHLHGLVMLHFAGRFADDDEAFLLFAGASVDRLLDGLR